MSRTREIQRVVAEIRKKQRRGVRIDQAEIRQRFGHLMPELAGRLQLLREIQESARQAERPEQTAARPHDAADDELSALGQALPDYQLLERISYGAQGVVYKARQRQTGRLVALKVLLDGPLASELQRLRFEREIDLVSRLQHRCIVRLLDRGVVRGRMYFAMEFLDGLPIDDYAHAHDLTPRKVAQLFALVAEALHYAHARGIIHRDLKPTNILVDVHGRPHLLDFGLAKDALRPEVGRLSTLSLAGQVFGTLPYLSPEEVVLEEGEDVDARADIYALGVMLFEVLTGTYPYPVTGRRELVRDNILFREPLSLRKALVRQGSRTRLQLVDIDTGLEAIVRKALAKDKARRYGSAHALAEDLGRYMAGRPVAASSEGHFERLGRVLRRYQIQVVLSLAFAALAALAGVAWWRAAARESEVRSTARLALATVSQIVNDVETSLHPFAGRTAERELLLSDIAANLEQITGRVRGLEPDDEVLLSLHEEQGDVASLRGRHSHAAQYYRECLKFLDDPEGPEELTRLARIQRQLGDVLGDGRQHYVLALEAADRAVALQGSHRPARIECARTHLRLGQRLFDRGDPSGSLEHASFVLAAPLPASGDPDDSRLEGRLQATAHSMKGRCLLELGAGQAGLAELQQALDLRRGLLQEAPGDVDLMNRLMLSHVHVGDARRDEGKASAARREYDHAVEIGQRLQRVDPDITVWGSQVYSVYDRLARLMIRNHEIEAAASHARSGWSLARALADTDPASPRWRRLLAFAHFLKGRVNFAQEHWAGARAEFEQAMLLREGLAAELPGNAAVQAELATTYEYLARCFRRLAAEEDTQRCYHKAYELRKALLLGQSNVLQRHLDVIRTEVSLATWLVKRELTDHRSEAETLLCTAQSRIDALRDDGRFEAEPGRLQRWLGVIVDTRQRILENRPAPATTIHP